MGTAPPNRSREPRIAMTKVKNCARTAKTGRSGLRGNLFRVDANLDTESSRNMLRGRWLGRALHKPCTTGPRDPVETLHYARLPSAEEPASRRRRHTGQLHDDIERSKAIKLLMLSVRLRKR